MDRSPARPGAYGTEQPMSGRSAGRRARRGPGRGCFVKALRSRHLARIASRAETPAFRRGVDRVAPDERPSLAFHAVDVAFDGLARLAAPVTGAQSTRTVL